MVIDFDNIEDEIVLDVWDWDAGKSDDWIGRVKFECSYFIQGYMEGPALGRSGGWGGGDNRLV